MRLRATRLSAISNAMRSVFKIASVSPVLWWDAESHRAGLAGGAATLFQDAAGTSAVTAVEQPVGLVWSMTNAGPRRNLLTFSEQLDNAVWTKAATSFDSVTKKLTPLSSGFYRGLYQHLGGGTAADSTSITFRFKYAGIRWVNILSITGVGGTGAWFDLQNGSVGIVHVGYSATIATAPNGAYDCALICPSGVTKDYVQLCLSDSDGVSQITVNGSDGVIVEHVQFERGSPTDYQPVSSGLEYLDALQATSTARPLLTARKNLLTFSEQFDNAVWVKVNGPVVLSNVATAPDGAISANSVQATTGGDYRYISSPFFNVGQNATVTASIYIKKETAETTLGGIGVDFQGGARKLVYVGFNAVTGVAANLPGGNLTPVLSVIDAGDYWRLIVTVTDTGSNPDVLMQYYANLSLDNTSVNGWVSASSPKVIWGAQLERGSTATSYQRVITATDYDISAAPLMLQFDGADDELGTAPFAAGTLPVNADVYVVLRRAAGDGSTVPIYGQDTNRHVGAWDTPASALYHSGAGTPTYRINGGVASGSITLPSEDSYIFEACNANLSAWTAIKVGKYGAQWNFSGRIGAVLITPAQSDSTRAKIRKALAKAYQIQGVV